MLKKVSFCLLFFLAGIILFAGCTQSSPEFFTLSVSINDSSLGEIISTHETSYEKDSQITISVLANSAAELDYFLVNDEMFTPEENASYSFKITQNTVIVVYFKLIDFTVTFKNGETTIEVQTINYNGLINYPQITAPAGKSLAGWNNGQTAFNETNFKLDTNLVLTAVFENIDYSITFKNGDIEISSELIHFGDLIEFPIIDTVERGKYFAGWKIDNVIFTGSVFEFLSDVTFYAYFEDYTYNIYFYNDDYFICEQNNVKIGDNIEYPVLYDTVSHEFVGWSLDDANFNENCFNFEQNITLFSVYKIKSFDIFIKDGNQTLFSTVCDYGEYFEFPSQRNTDELRFVGYSKTKSALDPNIEFGILIDGIFEGGSVQIFEETTFYVVYYSLTIKVEIIDLIDSGLLFGGEVEFIPTCSSVYDYLFKTQYLDYEEIFWEFGITGYKLVKIENDGTETTIVELLSSENEGMLTHGEYKIYLY